MFFPPRLFSAGPASTNDNEKDVAQALKQTAGRVTDPQRLAEDVQAARAEMSSPAAMDDPGYATAVVSGEGGSGVVGQAAATIDNVRRDGGPQSAKPPSPEDLDTEAVVRAAAARLDALEREGKVKTTENGGQAPFENKISSLTP